MKKKSGVSSRDVAKEAGVSQATVSYILNNVKNVKIRPETREAVMDAVKKLNYHPNEIARGMKLNKSMSIGVVTNRNVTNFYFMKTLEGIKDGTQEQNYSITLLLDKSEDITEREFIKYYNSNRLDGIIFAFADVDESTINYINEKGIPYVIVDSESSGFDAYEVCTDQLDHMYEALEYFTSKGISKVGYAGPIPKCGPDHRLNNFLKAADKTGFTINRKRIAQSAFVDNEIMAALTGLLDGDDRPEAVLASSPRFGLLTVKCALKLGIRVPDELRIIAFGTSNFYNIITPTLSAVELPLYDMGYRAAQMLFDIINGDEVEKTTILPSELIIRDSS